jgi:hypothetical protein
MEWGSSQRLIFICKMELSGPKDFQLVGAAEGLALQQVTSEDQEVRCNH